VLIDTGAGTLLGPGAGALVGNLRAAGHQPPQISEIYITHMHSDRVGGLLLERKAVFPRAIVRASQGDASYWLAKSSMAAAPDAARQQLAAVAAAFKPYVVAGRLNTFDGEAELVPGIMALPLAGQTQTHTVYVAASRSEKILFCGDMLRINAIASRNPAASIRVELDTDADLPVAKPTALLKDAVANRYWVAGAHLPFPGIGHLRASGPGFEFVPAKQAAP
jgi:glyoxylase-like metal-dependent hydrolase (beta-lactamase superfamily II)